MTDIDMEEVAEVEYDFGKNAKAPKDLNAPKKPMSAYFLWANATRPLVKAEFPSASLGEVGKKLGSLWKEVASGERERWNERASKAKKEYDAKFEQYKSTSSYKEFRTKLQAWKIHDTKKPFGPDPNAPKRPMTSYMIYSQEVRPQVVIENPNFKAGEIMKEISVWWNALVDRQPYIEKAKQAREAWIIKRERYQKTDEYRDYQAAKLKYKEEMLAKRNKLTGKNKRKKRDRSAGGPSKKQKLGSDKAKKPKAPRRRGSSTSRSRSTSKRSRRARKSKTPKASKRRGRRSTTRSPARRSRTPKAPKSSRSRSASRSASRRSSRSASRRSSKRRSRTPKASKKSTSRRRQRRARTPKAPKRSSRRSRTRSAKKSKRKAKRSARVPKASKRSSSRSTSKRRARRRSRTPKAVKRSTSRSTSRSASRRKTKRRARTPKAPRRRRTKSRSGSRRKSSSKKVVKRRRQRARAPTKVSKRKGKKKSSKKVTKKKSRSRRASRSKSKSRSVSSKKRAARRKRTRTRKRAASRSASSSRSRSRRSSSRSRSSKRSSKRKQASRRRKRRARKSKKLRESRAVEEVAVYVAEDVAEPDYSQYESNNDGTAPEKPMSPIKQCTPEAVETDMEQCMPEDTDVEGVVERIQNEQEDVELPHTVFEEDLDPEEEIHGLDEDFETEVDAAFAIDEPVEAQDDIDVEQAVEGMDGGAPEIKAVVEDEGVVVEDENEETIMQEEEPTADPVEEEVKSKCEVDDVPEEKPQDVQEVENLIDSMMGNDPEPEDTDPNWTSRVSAPAESVAEPDKFIEAAHDMGTI